MIVQRNKKIAESICMALLVDSSYSVKLVWVKRLIVEDTFSKIKDVTIWKEN